MLRMCCPCLYSDQSHQYSSIPDSDVEFTTTDGNSLQSNNKTSLSNSPGQKASSTPATSLSSSSSGPAQADQAVFHQMPDRESEKEYDMNSSVFKGMVVQQKFFNKSSYDPKFVWINIQTRSLCLSEHSIKERRHKEANIADITGVIAGPPEKYKATVNTNGETIPLNSDLCLSVKFVRGGGIDLQFPTMQDRDNWYQVLTRLILQEKELRRTSSGLTATASAATSTGAGSSNSIISKPQ